MRVSVQVHDAVTLTSRADVLGLPDRVGVGVDGLADWLAARVGPWSAVTLLVRGTPAVDQVMLTRLLDALGSSRLGHGPLAERYPGLWRPAFRFVQPSATPPFFALTLTESDGVLSIRMLLDRSLAPIAGVGARWQADVPASVDVQWAARIAPTSVPQRLASRSLFVGRRAAWVRVGDSWDRRASLPEAPSSSLGRSRWRVEDAAELSSGDTVLCEGEGLLQVGSQGSVQRTQQRGGGAGSGGAVDIDQSGAVWAVMGGQLRTVRRGRWHVFRRGLVGTWVRDLRVSPGIVLALTDLGLRQLSGRRFVDLSHVGPAPWTQILSGFGLPWWTLGPDGLAAWDARGQVVSLRPERLGLRAFEWGCGLPDGAALVWSEGRAFRVPVQGAVDQWVGHVGGTAERPISGGVDRGGRLWLLLPSGRLMVIGPDGVRALFDWRVPLPARGVRADRLRLLPDGAMWACGRGGAWRVSAGLMDPLHLG